MKPGGSDWKPGVVGKEDGHRKGFHGRPCIVQGDAMAGSTGRGNTDALAKEVVALSDDPSIPVAGPVTEDNGV